MGFNQATFLGVRKIGTEAGKDKVVMSWSINPFMDNSASLIVPVLPPNIPPQQIQSGPPDGYGWAGYELDPLSHQGQYNFGDARTMMINVSRNGAVMSSTAVLLPGRVIVFVPDTLQVLTYGYENVVYIPTGLTFTSPDLYEAQTDIVPIVLKTASKLQVWMDYDIDSPTGGPAGLGNLQSIVNITLCNFDVAPVSVR